MYHSKIECYLRENSLIRRRRKRSYKIFSLLSLEGNTKKDIDNFYRKSCKVWLDMFILSKDFYNTNDQTKKLLKDIINFAYVICNNNDPSASNDEGENFKQVIERLQPDMLVSDYNSDLYDNEDWLYNDIYMFESERFNWENETKKLFSS